MFLSYFKGKSCSSCIAAVIWTILSYSCILDFDSNLCFLAGKSRGTVLSPSRSTGPVWIIQTWENCAAAVSSSRVSTAASLISWGGRDLSWETCLRWALWGIGCAFTVWAAGLMMGSILADCGLCKRLWLRLRSSLTQPQFWTGKSCIFMFFFS